MAKRMEKEPKGYAQTMGAPVKGKKDNRAVIKEGKPDLSKLNKWFLFALEASQKRHWQWFVIDQFLRGNHDIRGNATDNTIEVRRTNNAISYPINKVYSTFRAVRGYVTRHNPKVEVDIDETTDEAKQYARYANRVLARDNQLNQFHKINKEWVYYGIKYGVGYRKIGYDPVRKVCQRWSIDPFDLLIGTKNGTMEEAPYVIHTVVRTKEYVENKFKDSKTEIAPDNQIAASPYKQLAMQLQFNDANTSGQDQDKQTVILKECWYRLFEPNKMGGHINKCVFTETEILQEEETPFDEYPFIPYYSEVLPNEEYPDGHLKNIISPQRMLNLLNKQLLEYNNIVNQGRYIVDKGAGFRVIRSEQGQIIVKNQGKSVQVMDPPAINPLLSRQIDLAIEFIETIGGQNDASMGNTPFAGASGDAIERLQTADSNNISDLRDNFEDALAMEAAFILKMYSLFEAEGFTTSLPDEEDPEKAKFGVVGATAYEQAGKKVDEKGYYLEDTGSYCAMCAILPENQVKVSVTSQLGETKSERLNLLFKLLEAGLPFKTLLEFLEFPNAADIFSRIAEESLADISMENMKAGGMGEVPEEAMAGIDSEVQDITQ